MANIGQHIRKREYVFFILPMIAFIVALTIFPVFRSFQLSLTDKNFLSKEPGNFVFFENYKKVLASPIFWEVLRNTFIFVLGSVAFQFSIGFSLALLLNKKLKGTTIVRTILLLTWVVPGIVTGFTWQWIFQSGKYGLFNYLLISVGLPPVGWVYSSTTAMVALLIGNIWRGLSFHMIIQLAGLQAIPDQLYESAAVDGATRWVSFRHITLPLMKFTILISWIYGTILTFSVFDIVMALTGGGPGRATEVLSLYMYFTTFTQYQMGRGASIAVIMFLINLGLTLFYITIFRRLGEEELF